MGTLATLTFKGANLATASMRFENLAATITNEMLTTFKTAIGTYHATHISGQSISGKTYYDVAGAGNTDLKAVITAQDENGHVHRWLLPGYSGAVETDSEGEKVESAALTAILAAIKTLTALTVLTPLRSPVIQTK